MREIQIGNQQVRVRATPLALLYYKQEFKSDLMGDLSKLSEVSNDPQRFDILTILQMVWAMAKADGYGKSFASFETWLSSFDTINLADPTLLTSAIEEATEGFFRPADNGIPATK
ncbi:hypothetical protein PUW24_24085 [Paenibacillus urinalis]|uniref:Phage protein n=1 Tax=Paenibacillus urinalis TaxID=521520 RepID=A0AAX3MWC3_9BACL|nr:MULTISPECIES: hypothetical protein [Paenibacillus]WDH81124.1 hypothetical protein PUW23_16485 [Paenibacillus urinalis]WDH97177.1 hypothetical protein PUW24_24085 [Paenibacillus urinalis]WDI00839.1 hypothetical protein PUW25_16310 [Paenibacillus urinalis]GAK39525.1 hypothetical protein TCA2_2013 [Paenibacillus sp. TCA20]